jgi:hypothetical protein
MSPLFIFSSSVRSQAPAFIQYARKIRTEFQTMNSNPLPYSEIDPQDGIDPNISPLPTPKSTLWIRGLSRKRIWQFRYWEETIALINNQQDFQI